MNANLQAYGTGKPFRLEIAAANLMRGQPEFATSLGAAKARRKELQGVGYRVTIFRITPTGGLELPHKD
jgi:hypothetical protein